MKSELPNHMSLVSDDAVAVHGGHVRAGEQGQRVSMVREHRDGQPKPGDGEFQDVRWHHADALPALPAYEQGIVIQALRGDSQPAYAFSGASQALTNTQH